MTSTRRIVLVGLASSLTAGCLTSDRGVGGVQSPGGGINGVTPTSDEGAASPIPNDCVSVDVRRPPIVADADHPPQGSGTKPQALTQQSVADYLTDFETAYAWTRILAEHAPVTNLGVNTITSWTPEPADDGFTASSHIETSYAKEATETPTTRTYVASYFVSVESVYRLETDSKAVNPRTHPDKQVVQCDEDTKR